MAEIKTKILLVFTVVAILSSLLRFGQRENNLSPLSDSDSYLDMAMVFSNQKAEFDQDLLRGLPHHYNRPFFPFLAGLLGHFILNNNFQAAFSIINIISAIFIASLLFLIVKTLYPDIKHPWFPSLLFLTAFPQMDFGYHILTETIGLAFALGTCYLLYMLIIRVCNDNRRNYNTYKYLKDSNVYYILFLLLIIQTLSFFTRETAWFVFVFLAYMIVKRKLYYREFLPFVFLVISVLVTARLPQLIYSRMFNTHNPKFSLDLMSLLKPDYILDTILKLGLAFNISWLLILPALIDFKNRRLTNIHEFFTGWAFAALGYIVAGYVHNSLLPNGYPLRMFFSLFPLLFLLVIWFYEKRFTHIKLNYTLTLFFIIHVCISILGVLLDSGEETVHKFFDIL